MHSTLLKPTNQFCDKNHMWIFVLGWKQTF